MTAILKNRIYNVAGTNGADVTASGELKVINTPSGTQTVTGSVSVSNFPATQPISATTLPLPTGAATETTLATLLTDTQLRATPVPISGTVTATPTGTQNVDIIGNTIGLSTSALQTAGNASLTSIDTKLTSPLTVQATNLDIRDLVFATDKVDASGTVLGTGTNTIGNTNQTLATAEFAKITDGTNTMAVKAASTAPVVADPASVVTLSPNVSTLATALAKREDDPHTSLDTGVATWGVRNDNLATLSSATLDYSGIATDLQGRVITVSDTPRLRRGFASIVKTTTAEQTIVTATAGEFWDVFSITATCAANQLLTFRYGTAGTIFATLFCANNVPNAGIHYNIPLPMVTAGQTITVTATSVTATTIVIGYARNN